MKNNYLIFVFFLAFCYSQAQKIDYSLSYIGINPLTGNYEVALLGTPDFDEPNGNSSDIGAVLSMTDNVFIQNSGFVNECTFIPPPINSITCEYPIPATQWEAAFSAEASANTPNRFVYQIARTESGDSVFLDAQSNESILLAVFEIFPITGSALPTSGDITLISNDDPILTGSTNSSFLNINFPMHTGGSTMDVLGVVDQTPVSFTALSIQENKLDGVTLFPNPTHGKVTVKGMDNLKSIEIIDVTGKIVMNLRSNLKSINLTDLNNGVYIVKLESPIATKIIKLIKQ